MGRATGKTVPRMRYLRTRYLAVAAVCSTLVVLGACKRGGENASDTTGMGTDTSMNAAAPANTTATPGAANAPAAGAMTDAQIFARLTAANEGEIAAGKLAEKKATNADVKAFARMMVTDHTKLLNDGNALAKKLKVTPDTAAADSIRSANKSLADQLQGAAKGAAFDSTYVDAQVAGHQATLDMLKNAAGAAQSADLKKALNDAIPTVQKHLDKIQEIQGKLKK